MTNQVIDRGPEVASRLEVCVVRGETYEVNVRGHRVRTDQPTYEGGDDSAPTPTELFVAALATCVAFYAGRYLSRHGFDRDGLAVTAEFEMANDRPARVAAVQLTVRVPASLPPERRAALRAVAGHCTVHNSLVNPPRVTVEVN
ncbi:MAG: OsmC family protein [Micromonosporaceae bacterium]